MNEPIPFPSRRKPRLKKLRLLLILVPLLALAVISTVFGMMMAVASDLPDLENRAEFKHSKNSIITDIRGRRLGILTSNQGRVLVPFEDINPSMTNAIIAIEDERFYTNAGVDLKAIGRAFVADVIQGKPRQGGSTITQQFVKRALERENKRTVFEKLREAALAYHLTRKWSKQKILTEYLNSVYFGSGAYGVESAARTYFGADHPGCGESLAKPCSKVLTPFESAFLAGIVQNPSGYDPIDHPQAAKARRNQVLEKMREQGKITDAEYREFITEALPGEAQISPPTETGPTPSTPYFTTWVRQQVVDRYGAIASFQGGLKIRTTLDLDIQRAAEQAVASRFANPDGPTASVVVIDNKTGEVRAMVGGRDYNTSAFNLATQGQRQPGSSFKPFVLAQALKEGVSPDSLWPSRKREFTVPGTKGREVFVVNNDEGSYAGTRTLRSALTWSDNSVFAAVGIQVGTKKIARLAERMGIRTKVSHNYAITLGGLRHGVTPLDMAHAYQTIERGGRKISGTLGASRFGPVGIHEVTRGDKVLDRNKVKSRRVLPQSIADQMASMMSTVVTTGTGTHARLNEWAAGKTGTTENYGDAWFVGFTKRYTTAVWVGYPDRLTPMKTLYRGQPVMGGTFPADIWHDVMTSIENIDKTREEARRQRLIAKLTREGKKIPPSLTQTEPQTTTPVAPVAPAPSTASPDTGVPPTGATGETGGATGGGTTGDGTTGAPDGGTTGGGTGGGGGGTQTPAAPTPATPPPETPAPAAPAPAPAPSSGSTGGAGAGAGGAVAPTG
ncbi:transglycosylase domain-containing protein [Capillimicrobium parvum]|uniref:Monofunctional glycosyltransferase n=1 Tax=Capillimicrobium parvum TaxID=2884022 RepID=A0A9E6XXP1_9ACTN|nr:transglycosylase domain-containing protein [Capillimicrobium parvum]UGS36290.1 Monofunctional glycosyltransferase [Capillimicrobium parvum]